jgi:hypothetical protein
MCIIVASFLLFFSIAEVFFMFSIDKPALALKHYSQNSKYVKSGQTSVLYENGFFVQDPVLGFAPNEARHVAARLMNNDEVIYDVMYSKDEAGRRITPDRGDKADTAVLVFGCSFSYGKGLDDHENFAWQLAEMLGEKYQVINLALPGYGSHQMLALIESGRLDALVGRYKHNYAVFMTIPDHVLRSAGLVSWDRAGPRYILDNSVLKHVGAFDKTQKYNKLYLPEKIFGYSRTYNALKRSYLARTGYALDTHIAIIVKSMQEMKDRYRTQAFIALLWPGFSYIEQTLQVNGASVIQLENVMPDYASSPDKYFIKYDAHPNAFANKLIAETLFEFIRNNSQTAIKLSQEFITP